MTYFLLHSSFRQRYTYKGRYRDYLDAIPTWLIDAPASLALESAERVFEIFFIRLDDVLMLQRASVRHDRLGQHLNAGLWLTRI